MKLAELRLQAFGGFEGTTLDFSAPGLHVVYGANEAGKSTTLRAVSHLLYGIPERTIDAYRHPMASLRIGARLVGDDGTALDVVRKKGRTKTLLDRNEKPIDDAVLLRMLHGVPEEVFKTTFGLSHEALERGAQALLDGKGDMGESLFSAGLGSGRLHAFLSELSAEAERIYSGAAKTKPLNEALRVLSEAKRRVGEVSASAEAVEKQQAALSEQKEALARVGAERASLLREQKHLSRLKGMLALFARREELLAKRAETADVTVLGGEAPAERALATKDATDADAQVRRLEHEVEALAARLDGLSASDPLADHVAAVAGLEGELAVLARHERELPRMRAEAAAHKAEAKKLARDIGAAADEESRARVDVRKAARAKALSATMTEAEGNLRAVVRALREVSAEKAACEGRGAGSARQKALDERVGRRLSSLGLVQGDAAAVCRLPLPSLATVARFEKADGDGEAEVRRIDDAKRALARKLAEIDRNLDALTGAGAVPTEAELTAARQRRDALLAEFVREPQAARGAELGRAIREADEIADRLRREAERVARLAELHADRRAAAAESETLVAAARALEERAETRAREWMALWTPAGISPLSAAEMRGWLERHAHLVQTFEERENAVNDEVRAHQRELERLAAEEARLTRERTEHETELGRVRDEWKLLMASFGIGEGVSAAEGLAALEQLADVGRRLDLAAAEQARVARAEDEVRAVGERVTSLCRRFAAELVALPAKEAGAELTRRAIAVRERASQREHVDAQLSEKRAALAEQTVRREAAQKRLDALMKAAGAADVDALVRAEQRSAEVRAVLDEISRTDELLRAKADGLPLADLAREANSTPPDALVARLDEVEARLPALDEEAHRLAIESDRTARGMDELDRDARAAQAAADVQVAVARVRQHAERWIRLRLSEAIVSREVRRYRDENQGPILGRASEVFRTLTLGAYDGLRAGYEEDGERPVIVAARGTADVAVAVLSEGTRDQLFLALRIASLERLAAARTALPLVLDDVLKNFDDDRAQAALRVLSELTDRMQVLFFTHHQRLVDLAKAACGPKVTVHELRRKTAQLELAT